MTDVITPLYYVTICIHLVGTSIKKNLNQNNSKISKNLESLCKKNWQYKYCLTIIEEKEIDEINLC